MMKLGSLGLHSRTQRGFRAAFTIAILPGLTGAGAQTPRPFPTPNPPGMAAPRTPPPPGPPPTSQPTPSVRPVPDSTNAPTEASLGLPIYPGAQFITSYDAGRGQRFYLFGTAATFIDVVAYYRTSLKQKGELVFDGPATHAFDVGKFKEETMAFPAGVTVKDFTWGGSAGYPNPKSGAQPTRFPTVVQIVPLAEGVQDH